MTVGAVIAVVLVVLFASTVQTVSGFGFGLLAVPLMSFAVDTKLAVVIVTTVGILQSAFLAVHDRRHIDRGCARRMILGVLLGSPVGLVVLEVSPARSLRLALAVGLVAFVLLNLRGLRLRATNDRLDLAMGTLSGVLNTSLSTSGPPLVAVLHARHVEPETFRATLSVVFACSSVIGIALFASAGRYDADALRASALSAPALVAGVVVGRALRPHVGAVAFRRLVMGLVSATAAASVVAVVRG